jgi:hypothetical protein
MKINIRPLSTKNSKKKEGQKTEAKNKDITIQIGNQTPMCHQPMLAKHKEQPYRQ